MKNASGERMCTRCVLNQSTPGISFGEDGVCNYCATYDTRLNVRGEEKLIQLLSEYKTKNREKEYDCMAGLSGGRDSTYTLYKFVMDYAMRVLCIHYDSPITYEQASRNMRNAAELLEVDVVRWGSREGEHIAATMKALKIWGRHPSSTMIPIVCAHCKNWWPTIFKYAH